MHAPPTLLPFQTDLVSLPIAICLSTIAVISAAIKVGSCFLQPQLDLRLLLISCISLGSSAGLLAVANAGFHTNQTLYVTHLVILQLCCALSGIFEAELLRQILVKNQYRWIQITFRVTTICSSFVTVGLCVWLPLQNAQVSNILTALLLATSAVYFELSVAYVYLSTISEPLLFLISSGLYVLVFAFACISLPVAWSKPEALVAGTWVTFTLSNVISFRFPVLLLYRRSRRGDHVDSEIRVGRPSRQDSAIESVPSPAMDVDGQPMWFR
ncbi:hypothetical protein BKA65DRAFT_127647 [Rhexocercosporidium sp. MPI-PUGE-AT-0058]|nr:hypothetical protein BKA65DRAFT_127647 [Rhexocercosporidium sp. MPI-PUGE-AT-0058]